MCMCVCVSVRMHVQEHSLTHDVLRKLCVREAELLKDPTMQAKIKFRSAVWGCLSLLIGA